MGRLRVALVSLAALALGCGGMPPASSTTFRLRVGHFPNLTHLHALVAHQLSRRGEGWFESRLGRTVAIEWYVYNAGPSAMEAFFSRSLDLAYVGPSPALNAHLRSEGEELRILAGATLGGAGLVVPGDGRIRAPGDFRGLRIATPQLGNTQDVACRAWLGSHGFAVTQIGGDVQVVPTGNSDQLVLFARGELDGVWTVEPWVSRLEREAGGRLLFAEKDAVTTVLAVRAGFLAEQPELARAFRKAHAALGRWIEQNPDQARELVRAELLELTRVELDPELLARAWSRLRIGDDPPRAEMDAHVAAARDLGFLSGPGDLSRLFEAP